MRRRAASSRGAASRRDAGTTHVRSEESKRRPGSRLIAAVSSRSTGNANTTSSPNDARRIHTPAAPACARCSSCATSQSKSASTGGRRASKPGRCGMPSSAAVVRGSSHATSGTTNLLRAAFSARQYAGSRSSPGAKRGFKRAAARHGLARAAALLVLPLTPARAWPVACRRCHSGAHATRGRGRSRVASPPGNPPPSGATTLGKGCRKVRASERRPRNMRNG